jgi:uncharacterized repeat protein (TIGR03803 family)
MSKLSWMAKTGGVFLLWAMAAIALPAQTFTTLLDFNGTNGQYPEAALVQGTEGSFYGTTLQGDGTVFSITPNGTLTTLFSFDDTDGADPYAGLVQGTDGNFYGTTAVGGGLGSAFKITPGGILTTLYNFCQDPHCTDGNTIQAGLVEGTDGNFYGTTEMGGGGDACEAGCGTVFKLTPSGVLTTLHRFEGPDGEYPEASLIQATDGHFYGTTTFAGGNGEGGTVFEITPGGTLTTIYNFCSLPGCIDGIVPNGLVQASNGDFYGTAEGGANGYGEVFKLISSGALTVIYSFCPLSNCTDGSQPEAGLVLGTDGNFYGPASLGGETTSNCTEGCGTLFKITPSGALTVLHSFDYTDGYRPIGGLIQGTDGTFYGNTLFGGSNSTCESGCGTVYSLSVGLRPFVETQPTSGVVGAAVKILGTNLSGATSVTFNGTAATFRVVSGSLITTTVPTGATTGTVQVVTPSRTLTSNTRFTVN